MLKFLYFLKMSWQFAWRWTLLILLFNFSYATLWFPVVSAAVFVFLFNVNMRMWPMFGMLFGRVPFVKIPKKGETVYAPVVHHAPQVKTPVIDGASENGLMTGFEPKNLPSQLPHSSLMFGSPGAGLHSSGFAQQNITLGVEGEENFAKVLGLTGNIQKFGTAWSVAVPQNGALLPHDYGTDIDCVIATNDALYLVDLKNYKSGNVLYTSQNDTLYCYDVPTGSLVGEPKEMSQNMAMAVAAVRSNFPNLRVFPVVVFMPTDKGEGQVHDVQWPGGVPAMTLTQFLATLDRQPAVQSHSPAYHSLQQMSHLVQK